MKIQSFAYATALKIMGIDSEPDPILQMIDGRLRIKSGEKILIEICDCYPVVTQGIVQPIGFGWDEAGNLIIHGIETSLPLVDQGWLTQ